jgi:uncharacterized protein
MTLKKIDSLKSTLMAYQRVAVAFSGGKDSFFLLKMSVETLGKTNVIAFFVNSPFNSINDQKRISYFRDRLDFDLKILKLDFASLKTIWSNPRDRCYHCKKLVFKTIQRETRNAGFNTLLDGSTFSDLSEYRPGLKAIEELRIASPLRDAGLTSEDIECFLSRNGIEPFYVTSSTCLATRFPYDMNLSEDVIRIFDEIEAFLVDLNVFPVRVRYIPEGIRIETSENHFEKIVKSKNTLVRFCEQRGLKFITLDIGGLKSGVWD